MDRMGNAKKLVFKIMWEDIRMTGKNKEGYPDPTASKAIRAADPVSYTHLTLPTTPYV